MPKTSQYWKVYNQKRKAYLALKKKQSREKLKRLTIIEPDLKEKPLAVASLQPIIPQKVVDKTVVDTLAVDLPRVADMPVVVDRKEVVDSLAVDTLGVVDQTSQLVVDRLVVDILAEVDKEVVDHQQKIVNNLVVDAPSVANLFAVVDIPRVVDQRKVVDTLAIDHPALAKLIHQYQTNTNYPCTFNCSQNKYCSNCWYFIKNELIDYKVGLSLVRP